jgi:hypothetical protein
MSCARIECIRREWTRYRIQAIRARARFKRLFPGLPEDRLDRLVMLTVTYRASPQVYA